MQNKGVFRIGIIGGSGSGKTTFANALCQKLVPRCSLLALDNYYVPYHSQPRDTEGFPNFDLPNSLDLEAYYTDWQSLQKGQSIERDEYTFNNDAIQSKKNTVHSAPVLIAEGIFILQKPLGLLDYDMTIFIDTPAKLRLQRRIRRDREERGYPEDQVRYFFKNHVEPSYRKYVAPWREKVDLIVPNKYSHSKALEILIAFISKKVEFASN